MRFRPALTDSMLAAMRALSYDTPGQNLKTWWNYQIWPFRTLPFRHLPADWRLPLQSVSLTVCPSLPFVLLRTLRVSTMASPFALSRLLSYITPPPVIVTPDYDGLEYRYKMFTFRPARAYHRSRASFHWVSLMLALPRLVFRLEAYFLACVLFYIAWYYLGKSVNSKLAHEWYVKSCIITLHQDLRSYEIQVQTASTSL